MICGAAVDEALYFCRTHWFALPLDLRARWRDETEFSRKKPSLKLVADVRRAIDE